MIQKEIKIRNATRETIQRMQGYVVRVNVENNCNQTATIFRKIGIARWFVVVKDRGFHVET